MRILPLLIICIFSTTLLAFEPIVAEVKLLRVEGDTFIIDTGTQTTDIGRDAIKAVRIHNGKSELKLLNDVVFVLTNQPGKVDTDWQVLPAAKPKRRTKFSHLPQVQKRTVSPTKLDAYARELDNLVGQARPGIQSTRDASDVRTVAFLARDINKDLASGNAKPSLLRKSSSSVARIRSIARNASRVVAARKRTREQRSDQIRELNTEIRILDRERQYTYPSPRDDRYEVQRKRKRQKQIDRDLRRLKRQISSLRQASKEEASQHAAWQKQSQL